MQKTVEMEMCLKLNALIVNFLMQKTVEMETRLKLRQTQKKIFLDALNFFQQNDDSKLSKSKIIILLRTSKICFNRKIESK